jgi:hypothetical protein
MKLRGTEREAFGSMIKIKVEKEEEKKRSDKLGERAKNVETDGYIEDKKNGLVGTLPEVLQKCEKETFFHRSESQRPGYKSIQCLMV